MLLRIKPACRFSFHYTFQRCHVLLQITRSLTLFFCSFLWLFLSYTRDFISLFAQLTVTCRGQFLPGVLRGSPRRRLNRLFSQTGSWKIEFAGGPPGPPKLFFCYIFLLFLPLCSKSMIEPDSILLRFPHSEAGYACYLSSGKNNLSLVQLHGIHRFA